MRKSLVYLSVAGAVAVVAVAIAASLNACEPGRYCLFASELNSAVQTTITPGPTSTLTPTLTLTAVVSATAPSVDAPTQSPAATAAVVTTDPSSATQMVTPELKLIVTATPTSTSTPAITIKGLAILGDSAQDEYQADNPRGGDYTATTFNWVEQLVQFRGINVGAPGTRDEPRRSGYEYNWARSGDSTDGMIAKGQHTGVAAEIAAGNVSHVAIQIGINDFYFSGLGAEIYLGKISGDALQSKLDQIVANIALATKTVHTAQPRGVLVVAMQDYITVPILPELQSTFTGVMGKKRVDAAFDYVNGELKKVAAQEGVAFFDYNAAMLAEINSRLDTEGFLVVGDQRVNLNKRGNDPHFGVLDDGYAHPGTVLSSLSANVYIRAFNREFGTNMAPFSDREILQIAGMVK